MPVEAQKTFEQNMEALSKMSPAQVQARIKELDKICICGKCPTYMGTGEKKLTFCAIGKRTIIKVASARDVLSRRHWLSGGIATASKVQAKSSPA